MHACEMTLTYLRGGLSTCSVVWVHFRYNFLKFINVLMQLCKNFQGWKRRRIYTRNVYIRVLYRENTMQYVSSGVATDWRQTRVPPQSKQTLPRINGANVRYFIEYATNLT